MLCNLISSLTRFYYTKVNISLVQLINKYNIKTADIKLPMIFSIYTLYNWLKTLEKSYESSLMVFNM